MRHYIENAINGLEWKAVLSVIGAAIAAISDFYTPYLWGFLSLYALDFISGILKSKHKGIPLSSRRMRDSVTKLGAYMVLITALVVASYFQPDFKVVTAGMYVFFMATELKSIKENVEEMGIKLPGFVGKSIDEKLEDKEEDEDRR